MRWSSMGRGDRDWRADREYFGRGRRGGRGGGPNPCFYYARGRCLKGSSCRYLHVDREASGNERSSWRRDIQSERFTSDTVLEDHTAEHTRGQWIMDSQVDRQDEFGPSAQQDHVVENQKQDSVASFNVPQEEIGQEPSFSKAVTHFPQEELWATKNTSEDREVMAYNKALELVGLFPKESVNTKAKPIHNMARVEAKSDAMSFTDKASRPDESKFRFSEFPRKSTLMQSSEYAQETHTLGGAPPNCLVDTSHNEFNGEVTYDGVKEVQPSAIRKEAAVLQCLRMNEHHDERLTESTRVLEEVKTMGEDNVKKLFGQNNIPVSMLSGDQNVGNVQENSVVIGVEGTVKCPGTDVAGSSLNMSLEASDLISMRTEIMGKTIHFDSNASAEVNAMETSKEESKTGLSCKAETSSDPAEINKVPTLIERTQSPLDEEASRKMEIKPMNELEAANVSKTSYSGDEERVYKEIEGELHASAALVAGGQTSAPEAKSVPLTSCTQLGQQHILTGQQTPGILPLPADVQRQISTCQPLSVTGISFPPLFQGQNRPPMGQIYPQNHPSSSMQYPSFAADIRGTYHPPLNRPLMMPQPLDQGAHPIGKLTSENTGYPSSRGWGQQQLTSGPLLRAPEGLGVSSRQSHIPSTSGSYYGPPSHGSSFPVDQFSQHQQASYPASQFTQLPRPANPEGFGQSHSSNPGGFQSLSSVPVQSKPSGAFMQPNSGASLPQQQNIASSAGLYPSQPPQSYRPSDPRQMFMSHTASQNYGQLNQSAFSSAFPVRPINQNLPASGQQPGQTNQFINQSTSLPFTQSQPTRVTFGLTDSFIPEQSQPFQLSSDIATKQLSAMSAEFSSQPATLSPLPSQNNPAWTFQGSQTSVTPSTGQSTIYSYSLTAIPPLSGMVQDPKPTSSSVRKDQFDSLYDGTGSGLSGGSKMGMMNSVPEARILGDGAKTDLAVGTENHSLDLDTHRSSIPASTKQSEIDVKATAEDIGVVENVSPENWSPGQPTDVAEADKDHALSKKSNRGLKMLRAAIADHVKEVLKPTWKEGYMSKEAFKTIAKKAVEKVIGNVPSHHIPKSQEKVDQYMKAARPKISKLVQGYVDKYLKL
ncbi:hypothetical protein KP509_20G084000 [Ceratopteris richardii]|uniref:C3H1-type domain-containing protein n=1 Tax=Ceratopteris richardii TaxID=49495 RepID=A0A8T2SIR4_CERRI|nr:hypothetical protein KP509_20G084000 [Ceratopteris richardii]